MATLRIAPSAALIAALSLLAAPLFLACSTSDSANPEPSQTFDLDAGSDAQSEAATDAGADADAAVDATTDASTDASVDGTSPDDGSTSDGAADAAADAPTDAPAEASCAGDGGCFSCAPTTAPEFLNHCTTSQCSFFDDEARLPLYNHGSLPAIP